MFDDRVRLRLRHPRVANGVARIADRRAGGGGAGPVGIAKFLAIGEAVAVGVQAGQRGRSNPIVGVEVLAEGIPRETADVAGAAAIEAAIGNLRDEVTARRCSARSAPAPRQRSPTMHRSSVPGSCSALDVGIICLS